VTAQLPPEYLKLIKELNNEDETLTRHVLSEATNHFDKLLNESFVICSSKAKLLIEKILGFLVHHDLTGILNYILIASRLIKSVSSLFRFD